MERNWLPRSECTTVPAGSRRATALRSAATASAAVIRSIHGVADDPVGADVFDRAEVELALAGGVLGDVGQPQPFGAVGGEVPLDEVVVHRRAGLAVQARASWRGTDQIRCCCAQPCDPVLPAP